MSLHFEMSNAQISLSVILWRLTKRQTCNNLFIGILEKVLLRNEAKGSNHISTNKYLQAKRLLMLLGMCFGNEFYF